MSKNLMTKFGFERVVINSNFNVWTCKLSIERGIGPLPVIRGIDISFHSVTSKKGKVTEKVMFKYATMDYAEHDRMQRELMLFLEEHAIRQAKKKYSWLHEETLPSEQELSIEMPADIPW